MGKYAIRIDRFDSTLHLTGKARTYEAVKAAVLAAGRYSVFEATQSARHARIFDDIDRDPELEVTRVGYPWIEVKRKASA